MSLFLEGLKLSWWEADSSRIGVFDVMLPEYAGNDTSVFSTEDIDGMLGLEPLEQFIQYREHRQETETDAKTLGCTIYVNNPKMEYFLKENTLDEVLQKENIILSILTTICFNPAKHHKDERGE